MILSAEQSVFRNKHSLFAGISKHFLHHGFIHYNITTKPILPFDAELNSTSSTTISSTSSSSRANPYKKYLDFEPKTRYLASKCHFSLGQPLVKVVPFDAELNSTSSTTISSTSSSSTANPYKKIP